MIIYNKNNSISFSIFSDFVNLVCVMSTRGLGDLNVGRLPISNAQKITDLVKVASNQLVCMQQVHSKHVDQIYSSSENVIENVDGLTTQTTNLFLGVKGADCVPLFFYDPIKKIVGAAHAGWRGTVEAIAKEILIQFQKQGSNTSDIYVAIGPHIGACCYTVSVERAELFMKTFGDSRVVFKNDNKWYLDLGFANKKQLMENGVLANKIDASIVCTSCQNDLYFSYRRERSMDTYGEMLGIIGMREN